MQKNWAVFFKSIEVMRDKKRQKRAFRLEGTEETRRLNARWKPELDFSEKTGKSEP